MKLAALIFAVVAMSASAATINVTEHGLLGDAAEVYVSVTTNSAVVVTTNTFTAGDIGKVVQIFRAGYFATLRGPGGGGVFNGSYGTTATNHQDLVAVIVDVPTANSIELDRVCGVTADNLRMTYGTDNRSALTNVIESVHTDNDIIYFPAGNYMLIPTSALDSNYVQSGATPIFAMTASINLYKSGIAFVGDGTNSTRLIGSGAWQQKGIDTAYRGSMFRIDALTNNGSMVFSNLTFDGNKDYIRGSRTFWPAAPTDGSGCDPTHHAFTDIIPSESDTIEYLGFTNCLFVRFAGEVIQPISGAGNGEISVEHCVFIDGNSTVINANRRHDFRNNFITDYYQVGESGQFVVSTNGPSTYYNNISSNIFGNTQYVFTGASTNIAHDGYIFSNNTLVVTAPNYSIGANAGKNFTVVSNSLGGQIVIGLSGLQTLGGGFNTNWLIKGNTWTNAQIGVSIAGSGNNRAENILIEDNYFGVSLYSAYHSTGAGAWSTNVTLRNNTGTRRTDSSTAAGQYLIDELSNDFPFLASTDATGITNTLSYSKGARHTISTKQAGSRYVLDSASPLKIPAGSIKIVTNATASAATLLSPSMEIAGSSAQLFYWTGSAWTTNASWGRRSIRAGNVYFR
jgi:hypothetical protein